MEFDWQCLTTFGIYTVSALLCVLGFILSCLSLSGTWVVFGATALVAWKNWPEFPHIATLVIFLLLCIGTEIIETFAGTWGVQKRGGSKAAGFAAMIGGFIGMFLGGAIPIPIIGNLLGMLIGSFALAFLVEQRKMKKVEHAAHVATGAVLARLAVIFLKVGITLAMTLTLGIGLAIT